LKNDRKDQQGMGTGLDYQTLENLDRNIFVKRKKGKSKQINLNKISI